MNRLLDVSAQPLIIGGMHRSGTSLTASLFASAGLDLGPDLLGANHANPLGYFEDLGFYEFHRRALVSQGFASEGFTACGPVAVPLALETQARDLLAARMRPGTAWGWKEPRTTLFLDFWQERLPEARHVFVFRRPWEVADSLYRRGDETFAINPTLALDVWTHYNRLIIDFVHRHPANCLVFEITQVVEESDRVFEAVRSHLGVPLARPADRYRPELFTRDRGLAHASIVRAAAPDAWRTYEELVDLAGSGATAQGNWRPERSVGECAVAEWARASRAEWQDSQAARESAERMRGEQERVAQERVDRERAEREARRRPWAAVARRLRRASGSVIRRLRPATPTPPAPEREKPAAPPELLPFPRLADHAPAARAA